MASMIWALNQQPRVCVMCDTGRARAWKAANSKSNLYHMHRSQCCGVKWGARVLRVRLVSREEAWASAGRLRLGHWGPMSYTAIKTRIAGGVPRRSPNLALSQPNKAQGRRSSYLVVGLCPPSLVPGKTHAPTFGFRKQGISSWSRVVA